MLIIDRFEGYMAIIKHHNGSTMELPSHLLPNNAKEGDVIRIIVDEVATQKRKKKINKLNDELFE